MSLFEFSNSTTFFFYPHFIVIYAIALIVGVAAIIYKKKTTKKLIQLNATLRTLSFWAISYALVGFFLLFCRYAYIYFLSMEFLHILNFVVAGLFIGMQAYTFKKANNFSNNTK